MYLGGHDTLAFGNQVALDAQAVFEATVSLVSFEPGDDAVVATPGALGPSQGRRCGDAFRLAGRAEFHDWCVCRLGADGSLFMTKGRPTEEDSSSYRGGHNGRPHRVSPHWSEMLCQPRIEQLTIEQSVFKLYLLRLG